MMIHCIILVRRTSCELNISCTSTTAESSLLLLTFFIVAPIGVSVIVLCFVVRYFMSILVMRKRELVALLNLSSWCLMMVEWLFLAVPWDCLRFVIVVFPDHTHLLFSYLCYAVLSVPCSLVSTCLERPDLLSLFVLLCVVFSFFVTLL